MRIPSSFSILQDVVSQKAQRSYKTRVSPNEAYRIIIIIVARVATEICKIYKAYKYTRVLQMRDEYACATALLFLSFRSGTGVLFKCARLNKRCGMLTIHTYAPIADECGDAVLSFRLNFFFYCMSVQTFIVLSLV